MRAAATLDPAHLAGLDALLLDAGNTVVFLDHDAVAGDGIDEVEGRCQPDGLRDGSLVQIVVGRRQSTDEACGISRRHADDKVDVVTRARYALRTAHDGPGEHVRDAGSAEGPDDASQERLFRHFSSCSR